MHALQTLCLKEIARCRDMADKELSTEGESCSILMKPITLCTVETSMLGNLSVARDDHFLSDLPIAMSSNHCKTYSLKSDVSERTHMWVSKWTTANYVILCRLERYLGIKYH